MDSTGNRFPTQFWHALPDGRVQCDVCPRVCKIKEGRQGLCFVRANHGGEVVLTTYGRSSGFCVDPIEKKPLNHFLPGTPVLSFGTAGCNLTCKFCQNWDMSKSREIDILGEHASPEKIAAKARQLGCRSVAFTYNDPVIFLEYADDTAQACHDVGVRTVAVTAGYISPGAREFFFRNIDAANVDLKSFSNDFYKKHCSGDLHTVLDTLQYMRDETDIWLELTTLLIPGANDSDKEIGELTSWVVQNLGPNVPMHFSAFHPDFKMLDTPATPTSTLIRARNIAMANGVNHAYTGNVRNPEGDSTWCSNCGELLISRDWYQLGEWNINTHGECSSCGHRCAGVFEEQPGTWGARRMPVSMQY
jgi:pyruvate formate lyase activating enzyme